MIEKRMIEDFILLNSVFFNTRNEVPEQATLALPRVFYCVYGTRMHIQETEMKARLKNCIF